MDVNKREMIEQSTVLFEKLRAQIDDAINDLPLGNSQVVAGSAITNLALYFVLWNHTTCGPQAGEQATVAFLKAVLEYEPPQMDFSLN